MALLEGLVDRWFAPPAQHVSELYPRHVKLIELMWTADGRGRETYEALAPEKVSYTQFVTRATQVVVRGLAEGLVRILGEGAVVWPGAVDDTGLDALCGAAAAVRDARGGDVEAVDDREAVEPVVVGE